MEKYRSQRGEGRLGCVLWLVLLVALGTVAFQVIPVKIASAQLKDHMEEMAQIYPRGSQKFFIDSIMSRANELDIPLNRKNVKVKKNTNRAVMDVSYKVTLDFGFTTHDWEVKIHVDRDIFII